MFVRIWPGALKWRASVALSLLLLWGSFEAVVGAPKFHLAHFLKNRFPGFSEAQTSEIVSRTKRLNLSFGAILPLHYWAYSFEFEERHHFVFLPGVTALLNGNGPRVIVQEGLSPSLHSDLYAAEFRAAPNQRDLLIEFQDREGRNIRFGLPLSLPGVSGGFFVQVNERKVWTSFFTPSDALIEALKTVWNSDGIRIEVKMESPLAAEQAEELQRLMSQTKAFLPARLHGDRCLDMVSLASGLRFSSK